MSIPLINMHFDNYDITLCKIKSYGVFGVCSMVLDFAPLVQHFTPFSHTVSFELNHTSKQPLTLHYLQVSSRLAHAAPVHCNDRSRISTMTEG